MNKEHSRYSHGMSKTRPYNIWTNIKQRCDNKKLHAYKYYGGRGIKYPKKWLTFDGFWEDMKIGYSDELTIDRINNLKGYSKENCRWVSIKSQQNNRRSSKIITYKGETKTLSEWCTKLDINYDRVKQRINKLGWDIEMAFEKDKYGIYQSKSKVPKHYKP